MQANMGRRRLTAQEKRVIRDLALREIREANPGAIVDVQIDDYAGEDGIVGRRVIILPKIPDA